MARRVSYAQLEVLWEFLDSHRDIALGYNKSAQARFHSKKMWETIAQELNASGDGATKDWRGWSTYWVDYKAKLKKKVVTIRAAQTQTGGGPSQTTPLNDVEKKFLNILGQDLGLGLPNIQVPPFPDLSEETPEIVTSLSDTQTVSTATTAEYLVIDQCSELSGPSVHMTTEEPRMSPVEVEAPSAPTPSAPAPPATSASRRRRATRMPYSMEAARRSMVEATEQRNRLYQERNSTLEGILEVLARVAQTLERIEMRYNNINHSYKKEMAEHIFIKYLRPS